jgi:hypothetical protein
MFQLEYGYLKAIVTRAEEEENAEETGVAYDNEADNEQANNANANNQMNDNNDDEDDNDDDNQNTENDYKK